MKPTLPHKLKWLLSWLPMVGTLIILGAGVATYQKWWPSLSDWVDATASGRRAPTRLDTDEPAQDGHDHEGHAHSPTDATTKSLMLSTQAKLNLGLTAENLQPIKLSTYRKSITVPAVIAARPGRSQILVASPLSGVITHVHAVTGEAVRPGDLLFEIRLTYEDLVETQTNFLRTLSDLAVEEREIIRLEQASSSGALSGKSLLDRRYAKDKLDGLLKSQREALKLHGLSGRQVDEIANEGRLLRDLQIIAPDIDRHDEQEELRLSQTPVHSVSFVSDRLAPPDHPLVIEDLKIHKGQAVSAGDKLCSLSDYSQLFIEAKAFEQDAAAINYAVKQGWNVNAVFSGAGDRRVIPELKLAFVNNSIDEASRTLAFFIELPNEIVRDEVSSNGQRHVAWKYRIGQRLQVQVPVEEWQNQIVLPPEAVARDGAEWFVFKQNGDHFDGISVHVRHRDQTAIVIASSGALRVGDVVAMKSAHQMQMAVKNEAGGAVDPHAGHNH
jgi:membrane fusion protein, heavy metal efflux system